MTNAFFDHIGRLSLAGFASIWLLGGCATPLVPLAASQPGGLQALDVVVRTSAGPRAGYVVTVTNFITGATLPRMDRAPASGETVVAADLPETDAHGHCRLWLAGVAPGTVLKVAAAGEGAVLKATVAFAPAEVALLEP